MSAHNHLFNSKTDPIPGLRREIEIIPIEENGDSYLYFHDMLGYATADLALHRENGGLLSLLDGRKSISDLEPYLDSDITTDDLLKYVRFLDEHRLLDSRHFRDFAEQMEERYEKADLHKSVTTGHSYPADAGELKAWLDRAFSSYKDDKGPEIQGEIKALYAPHIDPRIAIETYVESFAPIRRLRPEKVVILGTSHYAGLYPGVYENRPFILSKKDFELPLKTIPVDPNSTDRLAADGVETGLSSNDRAHRLEHSIELHLLFLSYLWDHEFSIVPLLVNDFEDLYYMEESHRAGQIDRFSSVLGSLVREEDAFVLISGDLSHVGQKFGDPQPAREMFGEIKSFDRLFLQHAVENDAEKMLALMKDRYDPYRVCGFPPLYTFLRAMPELKGHQLDYDIWDESKRESAVSYGSVLYTRP